MSPLRSQLAVLLAVACQLGSFVAAQENTEPAVINRQQPKTGEKQVAGTWRVVADSFEGDSFHCPQIACSPKLSLA